MGSMLHMTLGATGLTSVLTITKIIVASDRDNCVRHVITLKEILLGIIYDTCLPSELLQTVLNIHKDNEIILNLIQNYQPLVSPNGLAV